MLVPLLGLTMSLATAHAGPVFLDVSEAKAMVDDGAVVLDSRGNKAWRAGHVPGSWLVDWTSTRASTWSAGFRNGLINDDTAALQTLFRNAGVSDATPVLIMGAARDGWGEEGRLFWTLEYLGHDDVHIVDGGHSAWTAAGLPTSTDMTPPPRGDFTVQRREELRATKAEVRTLLDSSGAAFWDTRESREYAGETPYMESRGGHLPGATHLWFKDLLADDGTLKARPELEGTLAAQGLSKDGTVVAYCTGGVRSGFAYAVLRELGYARPVNYDGSMWEWSYDKGLPLEK